MIKKIKKIEYIGRFKAFYGTSDEVSFSKNTFIFGKNTQGKSTFTDILKSLSSNDGDYILGRKTFDSKEDDLQSVIIETTSEEFKFDNGYWNKKYDLKIFDTEYISKNIYTNDVITEDKQRGIASIILGEEGQVLENQWIEAKEKISSNTAKKAEISKTYSMSIGKDVVNFKDFLKLEQKDNLTEELEKLNNLLKSFKNKEDINNILGKIIDKLNEFVVNREAVEKTLEVNPTLIQKHFKENLNLENNNPMSFIESGVKLKKNNNCPFCSQNIGESATNLIEEYNKIISDNYKKLKNNVNVLVNFLNKNNLVSEIEKFKISLSKLGLDIDIDDNISTLDNNIKSFLSEVILKQENLNNKINFLYLDDIEKIKNDILIKITEEKEKYSSKIDNKIKEDTIKKINKLEIIKNRFSEKWLKLCDEYKALTVKFENELKPKEEELFEKKNKYAKNILSTYQKNINDILEKLGAEFFLSEFSIPENRREAIKLFGLKFKNSNVIPLSGDKSTHNLKNTLSDSDKRLLAFAFFIVDIKNTKNLSDFGVVLDDPMSSFDISRKTQTIKVLRDELYNFDNEQPKQLIVLTHENNFFVLLNKLYSSKELNSKFLSIKYIEKDKTSKIKACDVKEKFLKEEYYKKLDYFERCLNGEEDNIEIGGMRIILENLIEHKFYREIPDPVKNNGGIISWFLKNSDDDDIKRKINDLFPHLEHHNNSNNINISHFEEEEKKDMINTLFELLKII